MNPAQVMMDTFKQLAPAITILGIGLGITFNGINWLESTEERTQKYGKAVSGCGLLFCAVALLAFAVVPWNICPVWSSILIDLICLAGLCIILYGVWRTFKSR